MSFLDLETLAMHRRNEMDERICALMTKCDEAQTNIKKLEVEAQKLVQQLNCEPMQLKERFLNSMKNLDEYIYLVTDFNLSVGKIVETAANPDAVPVHDSSRKAQPMLMPTKAHLLDVLSEPLPSTSNPKVNQLGPVAKAPKKKKRQSRNDLLIEFSSNSCSQESVFRSQKIEKAEQIELPVDDMCMLTLKGPDELATWNLPAQPVLDTGTIYEAFIINVDDAGASLWIIVDHMDNVIRLMEAMAAYYSVHGCVLTEERLNSMTYCAYHDDTWYRCLVLRLEEDPGDDDSLNLYLVDIGEFRSVARSEVQPLARQFCVQPPYARCCHLVGVDMTSKCSEDVLKARETTLKQYLATMVKIEVEDNTSEYLEVSILLPTGKLLSDLLIEEGLADADDSYPTVVANPLPSVICGPPEMRQSIEDLDEIDITNCPEYEDPLEAVTGYHNRDEMDICKHYKGPPNKTCFKGNRCTKRHVLKHPDGWTLDRVEATAKGIRLPLPAPATWHRVRVTHIGHFDLVFVQYITQDPEEQRRTFGQVLPPMTLTNLIEDMNSLAGRAALIPLKLAPAPGELLAALYPPDGQWYRAMVMSLTNHDQSVEVHFVDFGNDMWVKENNVRHLDAAHTLLPFQAIKCRLAGVGARSDDLQLWVQAKARLHKLTANCNLQMHVISTGYDELEAELYNSEGSVAELMEKDKLITLSDFAVQDESRCTQRIVVP